MNMKHQKLSNATAKPVSSGGFNSLAAALNIGKNPAGMAIRMKLAAVAIIDAVVRKMKNPMTEPASVSKKEYMQKSFFRFPHKRKTKFPATLLSATITVRVIMIVEAPSGVISH